jgi:outer membrane protein assembly factor BamB
VRCLECGAETAEAGPFCARCGAPTGMPAADPVPPAGRAARRRAGIIAVAAGVAVACLVTALTVLSGRPGTPTRPRASATPAAPSATVRWTYDSGYAVVSGPAVAGGTVYVGFSDGTVSALDAATGRLRWADTTEGAVGSSPAVAGGTVYIGTDNGKVYALDART